MRRALRLNAGPTALKFLSLKINLIINVFVLFDPEKCLEKHCRHDIIQFKSAKKLRTLVKLYKNKVTSLHSNNRPNNRLD
jgi:hypothetical protein